MREERGRLRGMPTIGPFSAERSRQLAALQQTHFWFRGRRRLVDALLQEDLRGPQRILDVGCGAGGMLGWLHDRGHSAIGIDSSPASLEYAARVVPNTMLYLGDAVELPFPDGSFDGILMLDVLEHVDDVAALREARRVVRRGGWVLISVPAFEWLWSFRDADAGHLRRYSRHRLEEAVRRSGLAIERATYYQCALFPVLALARVAGRDKQALRDAEERVPALLNGLLALVNTAEARVARWVSLPWGSSLVMRTRWRG